MPQARAVAKVVPRLLNTTHTPWAPVFIPSPNPLLMSCSVFPSSDHRFTATTATKPRRFSYCQRQRPRRSCETNAAVNTPWSSRNRQRHRTAAVVLATIVALTFLLMLRAPAATPSPPSSTPPPPPKTSTTPLIAHRGSANGVRFRSFESAGGDTESKRSPPDLGVKDSWRGDARAQESGLDGGTTAGSEGVGGGVSGRSVGLGGRGGMLQDGRDRCFVDSEGFQRCYPTAFFFGTSKCGKPVLVVLSRLGVGGRHSYCCCCCRRAAPEGRCLWLGCSR